MVAANRGREVLLNYFGNLKQIDEKGIDGPVSEADRETEKVITSELRKLDGNMNILGEESGLNATGSMSGGDPPQDLWIVDPLDGTTNYIHGFPIFCICIGLQMRGLLRVGVVDVPAWDMRFHAIEGGGAFVNGERIRVSQRPFKFSLFATGFSSIRPGEVDHQLKHVSRLVHKCRGLRRSGSAAFDLCMVAKGNFDAYWETNLKPWDTAAATIIVREAGGLVTDYSGKEYGPFQPDICAGGPEIHSEVLSLLRQN